MRRLYRAIRQARPDAWLAAVVVACIFAGGSERIGTPADPKQAADVVRVQSAATGVDADGLQRVRLALEIAPDWHLYANPVNNETPPPPSSSFARATGVEAGRVSARRRLRGQAGAQGLPGRVTIMATVKRGLATRHRRTSPCRRATKKTHVPTAGDAGRAAAVGYRVEDER